MIFAVVFLSAVLLGILRVFYIRFVIDGREWFAATAGAGQLTLAGFNIVSYTNDHELLACTVAGAAVGTWFAVQMVRK